MSLCCFAVSNTRSSTERADSSASRAALEELEEEPPPEDAAAARAARAAFAFAAFSAFALLASAAFAFSSAVFSPLPLSLFLLALPLLDHCRDYPFDRLLLVSWLYSQRHPGTAKVSSARLSTYEHRECARDLG